MIRSFFGLGESVTRYRRYEHLCFSFEAHGRESRARMTHHDGRAAREEADERERAGELVERLATRLRDVLLGDALLRPQERLGLGLRLDEHLGDELASASGRAR